MPKLVICVGCGKLKPVSPCVPCGRDRDRARDRVRGNSAQRGYGYDHRVNGSKAIANATICMECGCIPTSDNPLVRAHVIPKVHDGSNDIDNYKAICNSCNSKDNRRK
jgi:hypothetical protein